MNGWTKITFSGHVVTVLPLLFFPAVSRFQSDGLISLVQLAARTCGCIPNVGRECGAEIAESGCVAWKRRVDLSLVVGCKTARPL